MKKTHNLITKYNQIVIRKKHTNIFKQATHLRNFPPLTTTEQFRKQDCN